MPDPLFLRLRDQWKKLALKSLPQQAPEGSSVLVSYPDDEGVRLNQGRPGAKKGPERILHYLGKTVARDSQVFVLKEKRQSKKLKDRHEKAEVLVRSLLERGYRVITLGGGHDYGYPDAAAYTEVVGGTLLNVDQHLDVRPVRKGALHSGTPFRRYIERFGAKNFIEWGIQEYCNSDEHLRWVLEAGGKIFYEHESLPPLNGPIGLSICLDAFEGIRGVSAPAMAGISPRAGVQLVRDYANSSSWMGLYECAPKWDPLNEDSARFAALLAYQFLRKSNV